MIDRNKLIELIRSLPGDWRGPPANLDLLGSSIGVREVVEKPLKVDAMSYPGNRGYRIVLNSSAIESRRRFSWAHELGHVIANTDRSHSVRFRSRRDSELENLCDDLAAEILMPIQTFRGQMERLSGSLRDIMPLSDAFQSSITATALRFTKLTDKPRMIIKWEADRRRGGQPFPVWRRRNDAAGPSVEIPVEQSNRGLSIFAGARSAWSNQGVVSTYETLLCREDVSGFVSFPRFKTESIGFGGKRSARFVFSLVQLDVQGEYQ